MSNEYIPEDELTVDDIAAAEAGELTEWRRGIDGTMWYRRTIKAIPDTEPMTGRETIFGVAED